MKAEQELIGFLEHIGKTYDLSNEDYFNLEAWIQTIEALGFAENEDELFKTKSTEENIINFEADTPFGSY